MERKIYPHRIRHGEYIGTFSGIQPLFDGDEIPIYRFPGGECCEPSYDLCAVKTAPKEDEFGVIRCTFCGCDILGSASGDMPDICPGCFEGLDWSKWEAKAK